MKKGTGGQQVGRDPSKDGSSESLVLKGSCRESLQFPNAVVIKRSDAETRKCAQKSAKERKRARTQVRKRAHMSAKGQKSAKERFRVKLANNQV